jgi:ABC-2 type transport system ATP-binding protein
MSATPARHPKSTKAAAKPPRDTPAAPVPANPVVAAAPKPPTRPKATTPGALDVEGLTKEYGELVALAPLDLRVEHGEGVVLVGHNGSGKTTLLRMVAGLLEPTGGSITVDGHERGSIDARAALSYLSDTPTFYEDLSVWEHLEYVARLHGRATGDWEQDAADLLGHLGLYERADDLPTTFSRGLRQKAAIAMAFVRPFDLLLVDEPFVGLDAAGKAALMDLFDDAHGRGAALVVATHELQFVDRVERCVALRDGAVVYDGTTEGIDVLSLVA